MIEVTSDWQTVDRSLAELENSWSVLMMASSWAMMANSWAMFSSAGKQLGGVQHCWQNSLNIIGILMDDNN